MWHQQNQPLVILAPMDGYTDPPFRRFIKRIAPGAVVFSEFLSAATVRSKPSLAKTWFKTYADEQPVVIQLFGKDAQDFKVAGRLAEEEGAQGIDINMGCPAKKVVAHQHGSALMKNIELSCDIIAEIKSAVTVPVTVKTRLGWEDESQLIPFVAKLVEAGLDAITIHGRTYRQKFNGVADYQPIYALKEAVSIPVFGNGDVISVSDALARLGNLDGIMVGRGAVADPWLIQSICNAFSSEQQLSEPQSFADKLPDWKAFAQMTVSGQESEFRACCTLRKYLARMVKELGLDPGLRGLATSVGCLNEVYSVLDRFALELTSKDVSIPL